MVTTRHLRWSHANSGENHAFVYDIEGGPEGHTSLCGVVIHPGEIKCSQCLVECKICKQCLTPLTEKQGTEAVELRDRLLALFDEGDPVLTVCGEEIIQYGADILARTETPFRKDTIAAVLLTVYEVAVVNEEKIEAWEHYRTKHAAKVIETILADVQDRDSTVH